MKIGIYYDTSHLMGDSILNVPFYSSNHVLVEGNGIERSDNYISEGLIIENNITALAFEEINRLLAKDETKIAAKRARGFLSEIKEREILLRQKFNIVEPCANITTSFDPLLGCDSDTDKDLIGSIFNHLSEFKYDIGILATNDAGMKYDTLENIIKHKKHLILANNQAELIEKFNLFLKKFDRDWELEVIGNTVRLRYVSMRTGLFGNGSFMDSKNQYPLPLLDNALKAYSNQGPSDYRLIFGKIEKGYRL